MKRRIQILQSIFVMLLFVGTFSSMMTNVEMKSVENFDGYNIDEFDATISEPSGRSLELLGQYDENFGSPYSMFIDDDFLYTICSNAGLIKIDISNPMKPIILNKHARTLMYSQSFCIQDDIAYSAESYCLRILNVSDMDDVLELGLISDFYSCSNVKVYDDLLIVNDVFGYIRFYNIADPTNLVLQNTLDLTPLNFGSFDFEYVNDTFYIIGNQEDNSKLLIYNVTNINNPVYVGNYTTPYESSGLQVIVNDSVAYVLTQTELQLINISNPSTPTLIYSKVLAYDYYYLRDMALVDESLYILNRSALITLDVSNTSDVLIVDIDSEHPYLLNLVYQDNFLYITNPDSKEIMIFNTLVPHDPQIATRCHFGGNSIDVCVDNGIAYVANQLNGTQILDISNPENPQLIGSYSDGDSIDFVEVSGSILYALSLFQNCLKLIDISTPSNPVLLSEYRSEANSTSYFDLEISEDRVILGLGSAGLEVIDVSDSSNPILLGSYSDLYVSKIEVKENHVYAAVSAYPVTIFAVFDISDPTNIQLVSSLSLDEIFAINVAIEGNRVYLICLNYDYTKSILIVSIDDPNNPTIKSHTSVDFCHIGDIEVCGDYLYLASYHEGLIVLKNTFDRLSYVGQSSDLLISGINLLVNGGYVFMASGLEGLTIFKAFSSLKVTSMILIPTIIIATIVIFALVFNIFKKRRS